MVTGLYFLPFIHSFLFSSANNISVNKDIPYMIYRMNHHLELKTKKEKNIGQQKRNVMTRDLYAQFLSVFLVYCRRN